MKDRLIRGRSGFQLVELLVGMTSASVLMLGVVFSIYVTSESQESASQKSESAFLSQRGSERLLFDLAEATEIVSHSSSGVSFKITAPEEDSGETTVHYAWNGSGTPLLFSDTDNQWLELSEPLTSFNVTLHDAEPQSLADLSSFDPAGQFVFESVIFDTLDEPNKIPLPKTYMQGDLLIAVVAAEDVASGTIAELTGWSAVSQADKSSLSMAVFYTLAPTQPYAHIDWELADKTLCAISHFRASSSTPALVGQSTVIGKSAEPYVTETTTSKDNALILRILATIHTSVDAETTNLPGHIPVLFRSAESGPSLGIAYRTQKRAGYASGSNFHVESSKDYISATLIFTP